MENVVLTVHLILALVLITAVLMQRSEGGGLGSSGGSANSNMTASRSAATALTRLTWFIAIAFLVTSITLTILSAQKSTENSLMDGLSDSGSEENVLIPLPDPSTLQIDPLNVSPAIPTK